MPESLNRASIVIHDVMIANGFPRGTGATDNVRKRNQLVLRYTIHLCPRNGTILPS
jgi:hypothetical protein